jgi:ribokinase
VLVVGSVNVDLVVRAARLPRPGETVTGGHFAQHHGGKGANQAVAASRMGASVTFVGAVGDDEAGAAALAALRSEGIETSRVVVLPGVATGVALIVVDSEGENQIAVASGANALLDSGRVGAALAGHDMPAGGVYLANLEVPDDALLAGAEFAYRHGSRVVINSSPARPLPAELLAMRPIIVVNAGEAEALSGEARPELAGRALAARTGRTAIVTLGAGGALVFDGGRPARIPAPPVETVDATGAGDAFAGAFAAELAGGAQVIDAVRTAVAAGALSVTRPGARAGMPTRDDLWRAGWDSNPGHED